MTDHPAAVDGSLAHLPLGKKPPRDDPRTLRLADYVDLSVLPAAPPIANWTAAVHKWPMYGNDIYGDCTLASAGHMIQAWTANALKPATPLTSSVEKAYWATGDGDTGRYEIDVLNYWRKTGIGVHKIRAYAAIDAANAGLVRQAIWLFGGVYTGIALPVTAQRQAVWDYVRSTGAGEPGSWGGHAVPYVAYDTAGFTCVTWGALKKLTNKFHSHYTDEVYAAVSSDWIERTGGHAPSGFDLATLLADVAAL